MCKATSKLILIATAVIFYAVAGFLWIVGGTTIYAYKDYPKLAESTHVLTPAAIIIAVGVFLFLLGIVGCVGAFKEQKCLLGFFFVILSAIFLGLIAATVLSIHYERDLEYAIKTEMGKGMDKYDSDDVWKEDINFIQKEFKCCGNMNYTDWLDTPWHKNHTDLPYPHSCCKDDLCNFNQTVSNSTGVYDKGCSAKLYDMTHSNLMLLLGVAAALVIFQLIGMIASCVLLCQRRSEVSYQGLVEPVGLRV